MQPIADELKVTYRDILSLGESNQRIELFDGECFMTAMPSTKHQRVATELGVFLHAYVNRHGLGTVFSSAVDVYLSETTVLQPDLSFLPNERLHIDDEKKLNGAPDLVVEILSETTEERDRTFKFREYARGGAKEYWMLDPEEKKVEVYQNSEKGFQPVKTFASPDVLNSPLFPAANIPLQEIFR